MPDSLIPIEDPNRAIVGAGAPPVIAPGHTFGSVTDKISAIVLARRTPIGWWLSFAAAFLLTLLLFYVVFPEHPPVAPPPEQEPPEHAILEFKRRVPPDDRIQSLDQ